MHGVGRAAGCDRKVTRYFNSELRLKYGSMADALQKPYQTNLLLAGYDEGHGPSLYWMDYLATMHQMNIAGTGYGALHHRLNSASFAVRHPNLLSCCTCGGPEIGGSTYVMQAAQTMLLMLRKRSLL